MEGLRQQEALVKAKVGSNEVEDYVMVYIDKSGRAIVPEATATALAYRLGYAPRGVNFSVILDAA